MLLVQYVLQDSSYPLVLVYHVELQIVILVQLLIHALLVLISISFHQILLEVQQQLHAINVQVNVQLAHLQEIFALHVPLDLYSKMVVVLAWWMLIVLYQQHMQLWLLNKPQKLHLDVLFVTMDFTILTVDASNQSNHMQEYYVI